MARQIEINYKNESGYEVLYPNVQVNNIIDLETWMGQNYYSKSEADEKFATQSNLDAKTILTTGISYNIADGQTSIYYNKIPKAVIYQYYQNNGLYTTLSLSQGSYYQQIWNRGTTSGSKYGAQTYYANQLVLSNLTDSNTATERRALLFY